MAQRVKGLAWSLQWFGLLLRLRFSPWPENVHMPLVWPKKKKKKKKKGISIRSELTDTITMSPFCK